MAKFPITEARQELGFTPSTAVRADIDVRTGEGEIGAALGQAGLVTGKTIQRIQQKRQGMEDTRSAITANEFINTAIKENRAFRNVNADTKTWAKDLQERFNQAQTQIGSLSMSDDARLLLNARFQAAAQGALNNSLIAETDRETSDTRDAIIRDIVEAVRSGTEQDKIDALSRAAKVSSDLWDENEARFVIGAAVKAGQKGRHDDVVQAKRAEAGIDSAGIEAQMITEKRLRAEGAVTPELALLTGEDLVSIQKFAVSAGSKRKTDSEIAAAAATISAYGKIRDSEPGQPVDVDAILDTIEVDPTITDNDKITAAEKIKTFWTTWNSATALQEEKIITSNAVRMKANNIITEVRNESVELSTELIKKLEDIGVDVKTMSVLDKAFAKYNSLEGAEKIAVVDNKGFMNDIFAADKAVKDLEGKAIKVAQTNANREGRALMSQRFIGLKDEDDLLRLLIKSKGLTDKEKRDINRQFTAEVNNRSLYERAVERRYAELQDAGVTDVKKYKSESLELLLQYQKQKQLTLEGLEAAVKEEQLAIITKPISKFTADEARAEQTRRKLQKE